LPTASDFRHPDDRLAATIDNPDVENGGVIEQGAGKIRRIGCTQLMGRTVLPIVV